MFDLNDVLMFVQVIRAGSFAEASRRLGIPANTLSRRIQQLETRLDTRLMQRSTRKLSLTAAGQAFFERCAPAIEGVQQAGQELVDGSHTPSGAIRVAAPANFLDLMRIEWIVEFLRSHPRVRIDFLLDDAHTDLIGESIDVAFRGGTVQEATFVYRRVMGNRSRLVASPRYLESAGMPATLAALSGHDCLTLSKHRRATRWRLYGPAGIEEVDVAGRFSANTARALLDACRAGLGIALLPSLLCGEDLRSGKLVTVLPDYHREIDGFHIVLPSRQQVPAAVSAFVDFAQQRLLSLSEEPGA